MRNASFILTFLVLAFCFVLLKPSFGHFSNISVCINYPSSHLEDPLFVMSIKTENITPEQLASINQDKFEILKSSETEIKVLVLKGQDYLQELDTEWLKNIQVINKPEAIQELIGKPATRVLHVEFKEASRFWEVVKS